MASFGLSKNVRDSHESDRSLLKRLGRVLNDHVEAVKEAHILDTLDDFFDSGQVQNSDQDG